MTHQLKKELKNYTEVYIQINDIKSAHSIIHLNEVFLFFHSGGMILITSLVPEEFSNFINNLIK